MPKQQTNSEWLVRWAARLSPLYTNNLTAARKQIAWMKERIEDLESGCDSTSDVAVALGETCDTLREQVKELTQHSNIHALAIGQTFSKKARDPHSGNIAALSADLLADLEPISCDSCECSHESGCCSRCCKCSDCVLIRIEPSADALRIALVSALSE